MPIHGTPERSWRRLQPFHYPKMKEGRWSSGKKRFRGGSGLDWFSLPDLGPTGTADYRESNHHRRAPPEQREPQAEQHIGR